MPRLHAQATALKTANNIPKISNYPNLVLKLKNLLFLCWWQVISGSLCTFSENILITLDKNAYGLRLHKQIYEKSIMFVRY